MQVWRKNTVRYVLDGQKVARGTPGATKETVESKRYYGTLRLGDDSTKQVPLCESWEASRKLLRRLQTEEDRAKASGLGRAFRERQRPLSELLEEYERELRARENSPYHIRRTIDCITALISATDAKVIADLSAGRIGDVLAGWRQRGRPTKRKGRKPIRMSVSRSNTYVRAIKGFSRWLWTTKRTTDDQLVSLKLLNAKVDRRHVRRALTTDELKQLVAATTASQVTVRSGTARIRPADRAMLYTLAAYTGLRASELASLTRASFNLDAATVTVRAAYSKRRRDDTVPLHASLLESLGAWLGEKPPSAPLWPGVWATDRRTAAILRRDLKRAGIPYRDAVGRVADFHALRHTFISALARSGVHPSLAKELARHSTITLTMDAYTHAETEELRRSLDSLPPI